MSKNIFLNIQKLGLENSKKFPFSLTKELTESLQLKACTFYIINQELDTLILRAQFGFEYQEYESFELPLESFAGRAYTDKEVKVESDLNGSSLFRDKSLINNHDLNLMVAIPIELTSNKKPELSGVVCLYPKDSEIININLDFNELGQAIGYAYSAAFERNKMEVRETVVNAISESEYVFSALKRVCTAILPKIEIEACSIYLYDDKLRQLGLAGTTGLEIELPQHDISFTTRDSKYEAWQCYLHGRIISRSNKTKEKYQEITQSPKRSKLFIPIIQNKDKTINRISPEKTGIIKAVNKTLVHGNYRQTISFTIEDVHILNYVCDILAVSVHMFRNKEVRISYVEKIMHGARSNLRACIWNLNILVSRGGILNKLDSQMLYTIYDTQDFLDDILAQIERTAKFRGNELVLKEVNLTGEVLINSVRLFEKLSNSYMISDYNITHLKDSNFFKLPKIIANKDALSTVFRNLIENAVKYRRIEKDECKIELTYKQDSSYVYIRFLDYGIGIPSYDKDHIFIEGYRSLNAISQEPRSTGHGLTQSKDIMKSMGGDLYLISHKPTTIEVKLKIFK